MNKHYYVGAAAHRDLISPLSRPASPALRAGAWSPSGLVIYVVEHLPGPAVLIFRAASGRPATTTAGPTTGVLAVARRRCAVRRAHPRYTGETRFPLILQNIHRYFFYFAPGLHRDPHHGRDHGLPASRRRRIGVSVGTLFWSPMWCFLWLYSLSATPCRHLCGGGLKVSLSTRSATGSGSSSPRSTPGTCGSRGSACSWWRSPTCTCGWSRRRVLRPEDLLRRDRRETHDYDVIVIGAGGAGLRAAIEATSAGRAPR